MIQTNPTFFLIGMGVIAGFIDSIAGGGGLITIPSLSLFLSLGPSTIGTNKIAGTLSALVALIVYSTQGHMKWKSGWLFTVFIGLGSFLGSSVNPWIPTSFFKVFLLISCPILLWILWRKDFWIEQESNHLEWNKNTRGIILSALLCGFYDGVWGPGGGTFMFLSLFFLAKFPLFTALAISKLANFTSAGVSLLNFAHRGFVQWHLGFSLAVGIVIGSLLGSLLATRKASQIIRPILLIVVCLLLSKVLFT